MSDNTTLKQTLTDIFSDILTGFLWTVGALLAIGLFALLGFSPWGK